MYLLRQNYSYIFLLFVVLVSFLCEDTSASMLSRKHHSSEEDSTEDSSGSREWKDKWDKNKKITFQCPTPNGVFPDAEDCSQYYKCKNGKPDLKKCNSRRHFDMFRLKCLSKIFATCNDVQTTTKSRTTSNIRSTTLPNRRSTTPLTKFQCPEEEGKFPYPEDCSKYYKCKSFLPTLKTCSKGKLFDGVKEDCRDAKRVHCGSRWKPTTSQRPRTTTLKPKKSTIVYRTTTAKPSITTTEEPATHTVEPTTTTTVEPKMTSTVEPTTAMNTAESTMTTTFESTMTTDASPTEESTTEEEPNALLL